jgi:protein-tyrosine phosphatase
LADAGEELGIRGRAAALIDINFGTVRGGVRLALGEAEYLAGRVNAFTRLTPARISRLVFVCLGNINRSAFADVVARDLGAHTASIGLSTTTGSPAFTKAIATAPIYGHDLCAHRATDFKDYTYRPGDLLLAMEIRHVKEMLRRGIPGDAIVLLGHWAKPHRIHIHDPHELSERYFLTCFAVLQSAVINLVEELRLGDSPCLKS